MVYSLLKLFNYACDIWLQKLQEDATTIKQTILVSVQVCLASLLHWVRHFVAVWGSPVVQSSPVWWSYPPLCKSFCLIVRTQNSHVQFRKGTILGKLPRIASGAEMFQSNMLIGCVKCEVCKHLSQPARNIFADTHMHTDRHHGIALLLLHIHVWGSYFANVLIVLRRGSRKF